MAQKIECNPECTDNRHKNTIKDRTDTPCLNACNKPLNCGGNCCLTKNHKNKCECIMDKPGDPGTCYGYYWNPYLL